jgi:hypothetical protein
LPDNIFNAVLAEPVGALLDINGFMEDIEADRTG